MHMPLVVRFLCYLMVAAEAEAEVEASRANSNSRAISINGYQHGKGAQHIVWTSLFGRGSQELSSFSRPHPLFFVIDKESYPPLWHSILE